MAKAEHVEHAFDIADQAIVYCTSKSVIPSVEQIEILSEAGLIAGVCLKVLGLRDESVEYMRDVSTSLNLGAVGAIPLIRQEIMMREELRPHLILLDRAGAYRLERPVEYYRTTKRVFEALIREDQFKLADALLPELLSSFQSARPKMSISGHVSFLKNIGQYFAASGNEVRALRLFAAVVKVATMYGLANQARQTQSMIDDLQAGGAAKLRTFTVEQANNSE